MIWSPKEIGPDWRRTVADEIWSRIPKTWMRQYDPDARSALDQMLSRIMDGMTSNGDRPISVCGKDGLVSLARISPDDLSERGDRRYGSTGLAEFLRRNPTLDLVPMVCGVSRGHPWVLDGHHRMRAYAIAGRQALTFISTVVPGSGSIRLLLSEEIRAGLGTPDV